jgi:hypothetical protein
MSSSESSSAAPGERGRSTSTPEQSADAHLVSTRSPFPFLDGFHGVLSSKKIFS